MPRENLISVKIDNLSYELDKWKLKDLFSKFGEIGDVYIPNDPRTGDARQFGFVRFYDERDAEDAVREMDGYRPRESRDGSALKVVMASIGKGEGRRGGGGRGGDRRGGDRRRRSRSYSRGGGRGGGGGHGGRYRSRTRSYSRGRGRRDDRSRSRSGGRRDDKDDDRDDRRRRDDKDDDRDDRRRGDDDDKDDRRRGDDDLD